MGAAKKEELLTGLRTRLNAARVDCDGFLSEAKEVVVFGSRSLGVNSRTSDLDVLCVTRGKRKIKTQSLDCICIPSEDWISPYWLGCELASHIAKYGVWIIGSDDWRNTVQISSAAVYRKERRVESLMRSVERAWPRLHPLFQLKYRVTVRRELQRLRLLQARIAVPPTPILDWHWRSGQQSAQGLLELAAAISVSDRSRFLSQVLAQPNQKSGSISSVSTSSLAT